MVKCKEIVTFFNRNIFKCKGNNTITNKVMIIYFFKLYT